MIAECAILTIFNPENDVYIENDASEYGLGSVLIQNKRPVAYASRTLTPCERNYAQIEKEMLAIVFGLKKFHHYIYGRKFVVVTDHKPLTCIIKKPLNKTSKRLQSMILKIQDYSFDLFYRKGTEIPVPDALSRSPVSDSISHEVNFVSNLAYSPIKLDHFARIREATDRDPILHELKTVVSKGWPDSKHQMSPYINPYFSFRDEITIENGILLRGERIIIPKSLQYEMKNKVHSGYLGINSCLRRARTYLYWPGMSAEIRQFVENCNTCSSFHMKQATQPLFMHEIPDRPWQKLGIDLFSIKNRNYLVTVDYFSQFFEVDYLSDTTSLTILSKLQAHFARYGLPDKIISDNAPQLTSKDFEDFCTRYQVVHETISPGNSKANGAAEAAVKIAKNMMKKCNKDSNKLQ